MYPKYCSPNNSRNKYSCLANKLLIKAAKKYNLKYKDKIKIPNKITKENKKKFWETLKMKINKVTNCQEEYCWINSNKTDIFREQEFVKSFRPKKPNEWNSNKNTWLSTSDIDNVLKQYVESNPEFYYAGAVPIDFDSQHSLLIGNCVSNELCKINVKDLYLSGIRKIGAVFNLDKHTDPGSHWVSMFIDLNSGGIYYFDSYAKPPPQQVKNLMERVRKMGNELIYQNIIDINKMNNEHTTKIKYTKIDNKRSLISNKANLKPDTPTYIKASGKNSSKKDLFNVKFNKSLNGGLDGKNIILMDRDIKCKNKGILVQKGFKLYYNNIRFQYGGSECGVYSIHFQTELLKGKSFYKVIKNIISDDEINKQRNFYYRPNN